MLDDTAVGGGGGGGVGGPIHVAADGLALFSGLGACIYLSFAERLRRHVSPLVFYALVLLQLTCYCLVAAYFLDASPPILLSSDPTVGLFGWTWISLPGRLFAQLWLAVVVDLTGNVGLVTVMKYVPALVVAAACLLGPLIAMIEGVLLGVESVPGVWTLVGGGFTVAGAGIIAMQAHRETKVYDLGPARAQPAPCGSEMKDHASTVELLATTTVLYTLTVACRAMDSRDGLTLTAVTWHTLLCVVYLFYLYLYLCATCS